MKLYLTSFAFEAAVFWIAAPTAHTQTDEETKQALKENAGPRS
jgi:hypothetical protein